MRLRTCKVLVEVFVVLSLIRSGVLLHAKAKQSESDLRAAYLSRVLQQPIAAVTALPTLGSLWVPGAPLGQLAADFKAHGLNDIITILVSENTSSQSNGNVNSERSFDTQSAITGLPAQISTKGVDPLFGANSATHLKGQGAASANSQLTTRLTGRVIAVLPNANLIVEAQRQIYMNNQNEIVTIRGVVQPNDISSANSILSSAMADVEIEMKGAGIISTSTRPPNRLTRAVLWLLGF